MASIDFPRSRSSEEMRPIRLTLDTEGWKHRLAAVFQFLPVLPGRWYL